MKLVIEIDDKTYKMIKNSTFFIENDKAFVAIRDGKPLPKGHWIVGEKYYMGERNGCCSVCKDYFTNDWFEMKYCPNCGAKMVEQQESEGKE